MHKRCVTKEHGVCVCVYDVQMVCHSVGIQNLPVQNARISFSNVIFRSFV